MRLSEEQAHKALADWLAWRGVMFRTDGGGLRLPIGLAKKYKRLNGGKRAWPDIFLAEPRGGYHGLFIELKASVSDYLTKSGQLRKTAHVQEQAAVLAELRERGYAADFAAGFDDARDIVTNYLTN